MKKHVVLALFLVCLTLITSCTVKRSNANGSVESSDDNEDILTSDRIEDIVTSDSNEEIVLPDDSIVHLVESIKVGTGYTKLPEEFYWNYSASFKDVYDTLNVTLTYRLSDGGELCIELQSGPPEVSYHDEVGLSTYGVTKIIINGHELTTDSDKYYVLPDNVSFKKYDTKWVTDCTDEELSSIKAGMPSWEVFEILGEDYNTKKMKGTRIESLTYVRTNGDTIEILFETCRENVEMGTMEYRAVKENGIKITSAT